jgi:transcription-repair coupling factor (superfamily II helicase)
MQEIGFQLYADMLKASVSALKAGREPDLSAPLGVTTEINLHVPALLPEAYCNDVHERLVLQTSRTATAPRSWKRCRRSSSTASGARPNPRWRSLPVIGCG